MSNEQELDARTYEAIAALCSEGDRLASAKCYEEAVAEYNKAWQLVPEPKNQWQASTWVLAAIADACFLSGYKTSARKALEFAMTCPEAIGNPFLHLRLGQVLLDLGNEAGAADELMRAYMGGGAEIFASEEPHYLAFLGTRAQL